MSALFLFIFVLIHHAFGATVTVEDAKVNVLNPYYLSVAIDTAELVGSNFWNTSDAFNFTRPELIYLSSQISPTILRIGGTTADYIYYDMSTTSTSPRDPPYPYKYSLFRDQLDQLCKFATTVGFKLIFGLNAGIGPRYQQPEFAWNPSNAITLIKYVQQKNCPIIGYELSNEPNLYVFNFGPEYWVSGSRLAKDIHTLKNALLQLDPQKLVIAADVAFQIPVLGELFPDYLKDVLEGAGSVLDVITWHWYPLVSYRAPFPEIDPWKATPERVLELSTLDQLIPWAKEISNWRDTYSPNASIWLGETSSASFGGQPGVSDAFVGGFWYLDQLGKVATLHESLFIRQTLSGSDYGLLNNTYLTPNPDFFTTLLWRKLMGQVVLSTHSDTNLLRVYAHCNPAKDGSITLAFLNLETQSLQVTSSFSMFPRTEYILTSDMLTSNTIKLNGNVLKLQPNGILPPLNGNTVTSGSPLVLPARSYGFVVFAKVNFSSCAN